MRITNNQRLPQALVTAVTHSEHIQADYSVTELLNPPQMVALKKAHANEITEDVSERIWALLGSSVRYVLQKGEGADDISEAYLTTKVAGKVISGTADYYESATQTLWDYKVTSAWSVIYADRKEDWEKQLNLYALLYREAGFAVKTLKVCAILRDWSETKASTDNTYPQAQVVVIDIPLWDDKKAQFFLIARVALHEAKEKAPCTDAERWKKDDVFAIVKTGRKTAVKLHDSQEAAEKHAAELGAGHSIVKRPGGFTRCEKYCPVAQFCPQAKGSEAK